MHNTLLLVLYYIALVYLFIGTIASIWQAQQGPHHIWTIALWLAAVAVGKYAFLVPS